MLKEAKKEQISLFLSFAKERNLELPNDFLNKIHKFCELIIEANKITNLISKNDEQKLLTRHVADSLIFSTLNSQLSTLNSQLSTLNSQLSTLNSQLPTLNSQFATLNSQLRWADIGAGAGFPVIPLCLYLPQIKFYAIENRKKRCEFLNSVKQKLNLQNLEIIQGKAESSGLKNMDFVSCRAVGSLEDDFGRAKEILKKNGYFLTVKSKRIINELKAKNDKLLKRARVWDYCLPQEETEYALVGLYA
jgi:16S rRNA (guanine527-N7)-methyltransferase